VGNTERITWIHRKLKTGRPLTAKQVAAQFEVSEKTAKRDIEYLRDRCEAPIEWNAGKHTYEYESAWNGLDFLDEHSLLASAFLKAIRGQFNYVPVVADDLEQTFIEQLPGNYRNIVDSIIYELPQFEPIPNALVYETCRSIDRRNILHIAYVNAQGEENERDVEPRRLVNYSGKWYIVAYDHLKKNLRTFALSRIASFRTTNQPFLADADTGATKESIDRFVSSAYGIFKGEPIGTAILRFFGGAAINIHAFSGYF
jgi:predicted DNA-binding transcriptional regulator YafY